ncbi:zinc finger protein 768-like [Microplitis mediator]|uniref:zinc finger protein 768-like n=1 Tax=Microplitis mediator TaxID=375433 RepID=UPI0025558A12|nr:zinc finger protein 768-like [Microplitis mediator]
MEVEPISHGIIFIPLSTDSSSDAVASIKFNQTLNLQSLPLVALPQNKSTEVSQPGRVTEPEKKTGSAAEPALESAARLSSEKESLGKIKQTPDKTKGCPIPTCSRYQRAFSRAHDLKRHMARHEAKLQSNNEPQPSDVRTCGQCGDNFLNDSILQRHINSTHPIEHDGVNNSVHTNANVGNNNNNIQSNDSQDIIYENTEYSNRLEEIKFDNSDHLDSHPATDKKPTENKSSLCGLNFQNEEALKEHSAKLQLELQNSPDVQSREKTADDFSLEELLLLKNPRVPTKTRSKSKSPQVDKDKIKCNYCAKTFKTQWTLNTHVAAHEGRYQFSCSICSKKFVRKSHFNSHLRSHEAARPYVCDNCGKAFKELKHRREHMKRTHNNNNNINSNNNNNNRNAIQNLLDSISASVIAEDTIYDEPKLTLLMPMNFSN